MNFLLKSNKSLIIWVSFEYATKIIISRFNWCFNLSCSGLLFKYGHSDFGRYLVSKPEKTFFQSSQLAVCSCLDFTLFVNGNRCWSNLVFWAASPLGKNCSVPLWIPADFQWTLVSGVFWTKKPCSGTRCDYNTVDFN